MRRFTGKTVSNYEANTEYRQALNIAQEKVLLGHIQRLVTRGTTSNTNVSQELCGRDTPWKEQDYVIYPTSLGTLEDIVFTQ